METNPPNNPTQGTQPYPGPDQHPKTDQIRPGIDEKSVKNVFPANSAKNSEGRNVSGQIDPTKTKTNDRQDGNKTNQQGPPSASERGMASPPSTSSTTPSTSTAGTSSGTRPKTTGTVPKPTKSIKAKKGKKKSTSTIEESNTDSTSEYSTTSEKEDSINQARFGKMNKVIKELNTFHNSNLQDNPEVQAPLQHNWGKEHESKQCAIDMYEKEDAARNLLAKLNTPSNKRPPESPTGVTPEAKAAVLPSPGGTTQVRAETPLRSTVSTGNSAQMPKLTPQQGATSSPGGSGVSKEVGGGTGRGEHDSLPKRAPPSGEHTDTTQQRDGEHPQEVATKADVNPLANLKGMAADRLRSSKFAKAAPAASYKIYDEYDRNVAGQDWQVVQHKRQTRPIDPKQLPPKQGKGRQAFWARHNEEHHKEGALGCGVKGCKWETNVRRQAGSHKRAPNKPYDRPQQSTSTPGGSSSTAPRSAPSFKRPEQAPGPSHTPKTPQSSYRKPNPGATGSVPSPQYGDSEMPEPTPGPSQATEGPSSTAPRTYSQAAGASATVSESVSLYVHKGITQKEPLTEQEFNSGWKLVTDSALHLMLNQKLGSNFEILNMSFEGDRGHVKCKNRETAAKVREILADINRVSAIKMRAWFPWESATSLVTVVRRDTVLTDLPYIIKMWKLLNQLPDQGWHRPQLKIADRVAIITFGAEGELLTRLEEMVQQKSKLRTAYSYDAIRIAKRTDPQSSKSTGSSRKEQPQPTKAAPPPQEEENMEEDIDAEAELQPDTNQGSEVDSEIDEILEAQRPHMEDLGSDMEQEGRPPLNWAEEAEKEERLREHTQAGHQHHS